MAININGTGSITGLSSLSSPTISGGSLPAGSASAPGLVFSGDSNTGIYSPGADQLAISTNGAQRATIDSSGRLLVGTSSSTDDVRAVFQSNPTDSTLGGAIALSYASASPADGDWLSRIDCTDSSANVAARIVAARDGGTWSSGSSHPGRLVFSTTANGASGPTERMRISEAGHVFFNGMNTLVASSTNKGIVAENLSDYGRFNIHAKTGAGTQPAINFYHSASQVGGITYSSTATAYNTSSDYRLKENVVDLDGAITRVKQLAPKRFNFIADETDTLVDGFLAHEAQTVVPEAVFGTKDEVEVWQEGEELPDNVSVGDNKLDEDGNTIPVYQGIDQSKLVPLLTAALQEALQKIETLEQRLNDAGIA